MTHHSALTFISDERLREVEQQGERARRECRSRNPAYTNRIELLAYQRGWDREDTRDAAMFRRSPV